MKTKLKYLRLLIPSVLIPVALTAASFETGFVKQSDGSQSHVNAYPAIARLASGKLLAVWSAIPKAEKSFPIVGALSADGGRTWSEPRTLIKIPGMADYDPNILLDGKRIFVYSTTVPLDDPYIAWCKTLMTKSEDDGATWSEPIEIKLPFKYAGKKHNGSKLLDGTLAMGFAWDLWAEKGTPAKTEGEMNPASGVLLSRDGINWTPFGQLHVWMEKVTPYSSGGLCEPALVQLSNGELLMIMRSGAAFHYESRSRDGGVTWDPPYPSSLMGHNTPTALWRLDQKPEEIVAIWNNSPINRYPLSVAISADGGRHWSKPRDVATSDGPQVSYPSITQDKDGVFVAVWQQQLREGGRNVCWGRFTREWVLGKEP